MLLMLMFYLLLLLLIFQVADINLHPTSVQFLVGSALIRMRGQKRREAKEFSLVYQMEIAAPFNNVNKLLGRVRARCSTNDKVYYTVEIMREGRGMQLRFGERIEVELFESAEGTEILLPSYCCIELIKPELRL